MCPICSGLSETNDEMSTFSAAESRKEFPPKVDQTRVESLSGGGGQSPTGNNGQGQGPLEVPRRRTVKAPGRPG